MARATISSAARGLAFNAAAIAIVLLSERAAAQDFTTCQHRAEKIWYGIDTEGFTPEQIESYLYHGRVHGLDASYNRSSFVTLSPAGQ
jgi:hypothetical protein